MIELGLILFLGGLALVLNARNDILKQENKGLRDRIVREKKWMELDKKLSIELARSDERFKVSMESYKKFCERIEKV